MSSRNQYSPHFKQPDTDKIEIVNSAGTLEKINVENERDV